MRTPVTAALAAATVLAAAAAAHAQSYDLYTDFSPSANPNGPWTYGKTPALGGAFTPFVHYTTYNGSGGAQLQSWYAPSGDNTPGIYRNASGVDFVSGSLVHPAGGVVLHPGPSLEQAVVTFTAPLTATYSVTGSFTNRDGGTATRVVLYAASLTPENTLLDVDINGNGVVRTLDTTLTLNAGDTLYLAVDARNDYRFDSTGVALTLAVPEPSTLGLLAPAAMLLSRRRR